MKDVEQRERIPLLPRRAQERVLDWTRRFGHRNFMKSDHVLVRSTPKSRAGLEQTRQMRQPLPLAGRRSSARRVPQEPLHEASSHPGVSLAADENSMLVAPSGNGGSVLGSVPAPTQYTSGTG